MPENTSTLIGESIWIKGHLQGDEDLVVRGRVQGTVNLTKTLVVDESGGLRADINVRNAIIRGAVIGNITATESVELNEEARVVGDISTPRLIIVEGARFRGNIDMGTLPEAKRAPQVASSSRSLTQSKTASTLVPKRAKAPSPAPVKRTESVQSTKKSTGKSSKATPKRAIKRKVVAKKRRR
jgi:cytoskeletal protein CcmA (bactofilin family)